MSWLSCHREFKRERRARSAQARWSWWSPDDASMTSCIGQQHSAGYALAYHLCSHKKHAVCCHSTSACVLHFDQSSCLCMWVRLCMRLELRSSCGVRLSTVMDQWSALAVDAGACARSERAPSAPRASIGAPAVADPPANQWAELAGGEVPPEGPLLVGGPLAVLDAGPVAVALRPPECSNRGRKRKHHCFAELALAALAGDPIDRDGAAMGAADDVPQRQALALPAADGCPSGEAAIVEVVRCGVLGCAFSQHISRTSDVAVRGCWQGSAPHSHTDASGGSRCVSVLGCRNPNMSGARLDKSTPEQRSALAHATRVARNRQAGPEPQK